MYIFSYCIILLRKTIDVDLFSSAVLFLSVGNEQLQKRKNEMQLLEKFAVVLNFSVQGHTCVCIS